jgi:quinol monooxygenase YgiN
MGDAETVICTFRVRPDRLDAFRQLLDRHWATLHRLELVTDTTEQLFIGVDHQGDQPVVVSIFEWVNAEAAARAHDHPDVAEIWEAMRPLCEPRHGLPAMEFPHFRPMEAGR